jgi:predicted nucleic acid-binding protein
MGARRIIVAVVDAGPLIHLAEINCLPLLQSFGTLYLADAVWSETVGAKRIAAQDTLGLTNVARIALAQPELALFIQKNNLGDLQAGELECLLACQQLHASTLLTDDLAVRDTAKRLNLTPVGSLGIVVRAFRAGQVSLQEAERYINNLDEISSLFVTRAIVELAIAQLRETEIK